VAGDLVTLVGNVASDKPGDGFSELVVTLDDGHTVVVVVPREHSVRAGDRVEVRGSVITRGKGPHPKSVSAVSIALEVPAGVSVGRAPYYRIGAFLAVSGALVGGVALASWRSAAEVVSQPPPTGWAGVAMLYALFAFIAALAISAGRVPFELGTGKHTGSTGRPAWAVAFALGALAFVLVFAAGLFLVESTRAAMKFLAMGFGVGAAAAVAFLIFDAWKLRHHHTFAWRLLRGRGSTGVVDRGALERRVAYQHKQRTYETTERDKDGNTKFVTKTERWIEGHESASGDDHLTIRAEDGTIELSVKGLRWSAPLRYLPGTQTNELTSLTVINPGDELIVSEDRTMAFAVTGTGRAAVTLLGLALGHAVRLAALALVGGVAAFLAARFGALS
jgi:hypothetical protein